MHRASALVAAVLLLLLAGGARFVTAAQDSAGGADIPALGEPVPFIGADGAEVARLTVLEVVDPFEDYDPTLPPERGNHFVMLRLEVENTGSRPFPFDPSAIRLQDAEGFLYGFTVISRSIEETEADPELTVADVPPGDTVSGPIFISVFNDVELVRVLFTPDFDRLVFLADLTLPAAATPVPTDEGAEEEATPAAAVDTGCEGVEDWFTGTEEVVSTAGEVIGTLTAGDFADFSTDDLEEIATQLEETAAAQAALDVPDAAADANDLILQALDDFSAAIDQAIAAEGDAAALEEAGQAVQDTVRLVVGDVSTALADLAAECGVDA